MSLRRNMTLRRGGVSMNEKGREKIARGKRMLYLLYGGNIPPG